MEDPISTLTKRVQALEQQLIDIRTLLKNSNNILVKAQDRYEKANFIFNPTGDYDKNTLDILHYEKYVDALPFVSIVMPIHNQENVIKKNLEALILNTVEHRYEIILILDACSDSTKAAVEKWIRTLIPPTNLMSLLVFESSMPLFETAADNLGFYCARGEYVLEVQADIEIVELGYNLKLYEPFKALQDILGISGRGCHAFLRPESAGRISHSVEYPLPPDYPRNLLFISDTCIRGPLMLHRPKLIEMGFLDEVHFFLDNSDHDLFMRAYMEKGWRCGYTPVDYISPLSDGSTRKPRDALNAEHYHRKNAIYLAEDGGGKYNEYLIKLQETEKDGKIREMEIFELLYKLDNVQVSTYPNSARTVPSEPTQEVCRELQDAEACPVSPTAA